MPNLSIAASVFALIFIAEIPDKTMIATLIMGSRSRPALVWIGASLGFLLQTVVAVGAGGLLLLLPHKALEIITSILFLGGAIYLLFVPEKSEIEKGEQQSATEAQVQAQAQSPRKVIASAFIVIFLGEFGDLTQILTVNFVAKYHQALLVGFSAGAALVAVAGLGAFGGRILLKVLPINVVRKTGGIVFLGMAAWSIYGLITA